MIRIKNYEIFSCDFRCGYHWSKLKIRELMRDNSFLLENAKFKKSDLRFADLRYSKFEGVKICDSDFSEVKFNSAKISDLRVRKSNFVGVDFRGADIKNCEFNNSNFMFSNFRGAKLVNVRFKNTIISDVDFRYAYIENCDFSRCKLNDLDFRLSKLRRVKLPELDGKKVVTSDCMYFYPFGDKNGQLVLFKTNLGLLVHYDDFYGNLKKFNKGKSREFNYVIKLAELKFNIKGV